MLFALVLLDKVMLGATWCSTIVDKSWCGNIVGYSATIWNDVGECAVGAMGMPSCGLQSFLNYISLVMFFSKFNLKPH